jgi:hypothetical protein
MVTVLALRGITTGCLSAWTERLRRADRAAAPERIGLGGQPTRAAHAQGAGSMNLQIHHVISNITGLTGRAIVDAILAGQPDGAELAKLRDPHIKADTETTENRWRATGGLSICFTLGQSRDLYRIYQQQIVNRDLEIEKMLQQFEPRTDPAERPLPPDRKPNRAGSKRRKKNGHPHPEFDLRTETYKLSNSRLRGKRVAIVQWGRPRHVELAHRSTLYLLACTLSGQRHQRRETIVEPEKSKTGPAIYSAWQRAAGGLAGPAAFRGHGAGRVPAGSLDDFAHAAADRSGHASRSIRLGVGRAGRSWVAERPADRD